MSVGPSLKSGAGPSRAPAIVPLVLGTPRATARWPLNRQSDYSIIVLVLVLVRWGEMQTGRQTPHVVNRAGFNVNGFSISLFLNLDCHKEKHLMLHGSILESFRSQST